MWVRRHFRCDAPARASSTRSSSVRVNMLFTPVANACIGEGGRAETDGEGAVVGDGTPVEVDGKPPAGEASGTADSTVKIS